MIDPNKPTYWYFKSALSKELCEKIIQTGLSKTPQKESILNCSYLLIPFLLISTFFIN